MIRLGQENNIFALQDEDDEVVMILTWLKERYDKSTYCNLVRQVFLHLPPTSLKRARMVCREWDQLIKEEVWESKDGRKVMERRLEEQWRQSQPTRREALLGPGYSVEDIKCDESHITIITVSYVEATDEEESDSSDEEDLRGKMRLWLYTATDLSLIYHRLIDSNPFHQAVVGIGTNVLAVLLDEDTEGYVLRVWRKGDGLELYDRRITTNIPYIYVDPPLIVRGDTIVVGCPTDVDQVHIYRYQAVSYTHLTLPTKA